MSSIRTLQDCTSVRLLLAGTTNWGVSGDELAVRLPRTPRAPALLRNEQQWLPVLAPSLPVRVPTPVRMLTVSTLPEPWTIAAWVPGVSRLRTVPAWRNA